MNIRGRNIENIINICKYVEKDYFPLFCKDRRLYFRVKSCLVNKEYIKYLCFTQTLFKLRYNLKLSALYCHLKEIVIFIKCYFFSKKITCNLASDKILINNNIRLFYLSPHLMLTIKIFQMKNNAQKEVNSRNLTNKSEINVPEIHNYNTRGPHCYIVEQFIIGRELSRINEKKEICNRVISDLFSFYEKNGIIFKSINDIANWENIGELLRTSLSLATWVNKSIKKDILSEAKRILHSKQYIPCSLGHGDLAKGEIMVDKYDNIFFCDWENYQEIPIAFDLGKLFFQIISLREYIIGKIDNLNSFYNQALSALEQIMFSEIIKLSHWRDSSIHFIKTNRPKKFAKKHKEHVQNLIYLVGVIQ